MSINFGELNMKSPLILVLVFFMVACENENPPVMSDKKNLAVTDDSLQKLKGIEKDLSDSILKNKEFIVGDEHFWSSKYIKVDNFSFLTGYLPMDQIKKQFDKDPQTKSTLGEYIEGGDCGYLINTMSNKNNRLYYMKGDCGEYGFSNNQYYLQHDSLKLIREFSVGINTWPSESEQSTWKVEETIYIFNKDEIQIKKRELITASDLLKKVFLIRKKTFIEKTVSLESIYEEKKKEMISNLEMKTLE